MSHKWTLPLLLGLATCMLLALALWPEQIPRRALVVAARDLGAGTELRASDLTVVSVPQEQAPAEAVDNPDLVANHTLAVVRYAGEPVTPRHLGPSVALAPNERGIALQVQADSGLAGLLRPGMHVGVVATLEHAEGLVYAKALLEGLRVIYVPDEFQAQPTAQVVYAGANAAPPSSAAASRSGVRDGVVVLAAGIAPVEISYRLPTVATAEPVTSTLDGLLGRPDAPVEEPAPRIVIPVELLAALNAAGAAFTLVLTPEEADAYTTPGLLLGDLMGVDRPAANSVISLGGRP